MDDMGKSVPAASASKNCLVLKGRKEHALLKLYENNLAPFSASEENLAGK